MYAYSQRTESFCGWVKSRARKRFIYCTRAHMHVKSRDAEAPSMHWAWYRCGLITIYYKSLLNSLKLYTERGDGFSDLWLFTITFDLTKWQLGSTVREASAYLPSCLWSLFGTVAWMHKAVSDWLNLILIQFLCGCYA